jgi:hypothetical protein
MTEGQGLMGSAFLFSAPPDSFKALNSGGSGAGPLGGMIEGFQDLREKPPINLTVDLLPKVAFRYPTRGLQVPKAYLTRLFSQDLRPPTSIFILRLVRFPNKLNSLFVSLKLFFKRLSQRSMFDIEINI